MVKRVYRTTCFGFADAARDQRLDVACFDLDVDNRPVADEIQRLGERRYASAVSERELLELRSGKIGDRLVCRSLRVPGVNDGIVVNDDNPVIGGVHVQLYSVGAELDGTLEGRERVLGMCLVRPAMSDALRRVLSSTCSQVFSQVVAL